MNTAEAKKWVLIGVGGSVLIASVSSLARTQSLPSARVPIGGFGSGLILSVLAEAWPEMAGKVAAVMLVTSAAVYGGPVAEALVKLTTKPPEVGPDGQQLGPGQIPGGVTGEGNFRASSTPSTRPPNYTAPTIVNV